MEIASISNLAWILIGVLAFIGVMVVVRVKARDKVIGFKRNTVVGVFLILAVALFLIQSGTFVGMGLNAFALGGTTVVVGEGTQTNLGADVLGCDLGTKTTLTLSAVNKYTTVATGGNHRYRVNGNPALTVSDAGTLTVSPGDKIAILWGNETGTYYGKTDNFVVPCTGAKTYSASLVANGTLTIDAFNSNDVLIDGNENNETIGADATTNIRIRLKGPSKAGFPYGGVLSLEFNSSDFDEQNIELTSNDISLVSGVATPSTHTVTSTINKVLNWDIGAIEGTGEINLNLYLDSDGTNNPGTILDPVLTFRPKDLFINEDNGGAYEGPAVTDEDDTATMQYTSAVTIHLT